MASAKIQSEARHRESLDRAVHGFLHPPGWLEAYAIGGRGGRDGEIPGRVTSATLHTDALVGASPWTPDRPVLHTLSVGARLCLGISTATHTGCPTRDRKGSDQLLGCAPRIVCGRPGIALGPCGERTDPNAIPCPTCAPSPTIDGAHCAITACTEEQPVCLRTSRAKHVHLVLSVAETWTDSEPASS